MATILVGSVRGKDLSYDIYLREPVTGEVANVPEHLMIGGTYRADYHPETGTFTPVLNIGRISVSNRNCNTDEGYCQRDIFFLY